MSRKEYRAYQGLVQYIFQNPYSSLNPRMNVLEALSEPLHVRKITGNAAKKKILSALDAVGMGDDVLYKYPHEFSGGQRQRISVARALMLDPEYLVLDEPVSSLDVSIQGQILNMLLSLKKEKTAGYLLISHNLAVVRQIADSLLVLYLGHALEYGNAEKIFQNPRHPYTRSLLASVPGRTGKIHVLEGEVPSNIHLPAGCPFHPRCPVKNKIPECYSEMPPLTGDEDHRTACFLA